MNDAVLDLHVNKVNKQIDGAYTVTSLPDGGCLVFNFIKKRHSQLVRLDKEGNTLPPWYTFKDFSDIRSIIHSEGTLFFLEYNGNITKCRLSDLSKSVKAYKVDVGELWDGALLDVDTLLLADGGRGEVFTFSLRNEKKEIMAKGMKNPVSVDYRMEKKDILYAVCESAANCISLYDSTWKLKKIIGSEGSRDGELNIPRCALFSPWNTILVADMFNDRVSEFSLDGIFVRHVLDKHVLTKQDNFIRPMYLSCTNQGLWVSDAHRQLKRFK